MDKIIVDARTALAESDEAVPIGLQIALDAVRDLATVAAKLGRERDDLEARIVASGARMLERYARAHAEPSALPAERVAELERQLAHAREEWKKYQDLSCQQAGELDRLAASATALTRAELDALIDFHDYNDAGAEAMDCVEQSKYHAERSKHYAALRDALPPADSGSDKGAP